MDNKHDDNGMRGRVCVTGANGYVASWLVKNLLESGYHVTGTVRDPGDCKKNSHLLELEGANERLRLMRADLTEEGSFDDAVMGCEGVFHTANPVVASRPMSDPKDEYVDIVVKGILNVLRSCKKNTMLKKVVLTSSISTVARPAGFPDDLVLDETSWSSIEVLEKLKLWYPLAKTLAEQAAWDFAKANNINLISVVPSFIIGPSLPPNLHGSALNILALLKGDNERLSRHWRMGYVHIDDVARCHILTYEEDSARGRYLCTSSVLDATELVAFLTKRYPCLHIPSSFHNYEDRPHFEYDTTKVKKLGMKFKGVEHMFDDFIHYLTTHGFLP